MSETGLLLINVGSPDEPTPKAVGRYLRQFLMDPDVIAAPWFVRFPLVNGIIVPFRAEASAEKYKKVWLEEGSPLIALSKRFAEKLQKHLGPSVAVELGMRYGNPSIEQALKNLLAKGVKKIVAAPLFPQHAGATTRTAFKEVARLAKKFKIGVPIVELEHFYHHEAFLGAFAHQITKHEHQKFDHLLFSFHGLPVKQAVSGPHCYRTQCHETAQKLAQILEVPEGKWSVSFQSRLGRQEWLQPSTDNTLLQLLEQGKRRVLVACPSFVTDCLETYEEIGLGAKEDFLRAGGVEFKLASCPNDDDLWVRGFSEIVTSKWE